MVVPVFLSLSVVAASPRPTPPLYLFKAALIKGTAAAPIGPPATAPKAAHGPYLPTNLPSFPNILPRPVANPLPTVVKPLPIFFKEEVTPFATLPTEKAFLAP